VSLAVVPALDETVHAENNPAGSAETAPAASADRRSLRRVRRNETWAPSDVFFQTSPFGLLEGLYIFFAMHRESILAEIADDATGKGRNLITPDSNYRTASRACLPWRGR
jgi:hypothetical protein